MNTLVYVASSRPVGDRCRAWARDHLPPGAELTPYPNESDVFLSVMYDTLLDERFIGGVGASGRPRRCYNFHPGVLPEYRGSGAFSWAIINGERETGVTLHELDVDVDHGPVISLVRFEIRDHDTAETLFTTAMDIMFSQFRVYFPRLASGDPPKSTPQDESRARVYYRRDLQRARDLTRLVRAFTFEGKEPAFYLTRAGERVEVKW